MTDLERERTASGILLRRATRVLGGILILAGLVPAAISMPALYEQWESRHWPSVRGQIVQGGYFHPPGQDTQVPVVAFTVNNRPYRQVVAFRPDDPLLHAKTDKDRHRFAFGTYVPVYYNPSEVADTVNLDIHRLNDVALTRGLAPGALTPVCTDCASIAAGLLLVWLPDGFIWDRPRRV